VPAWLIWAIVAALLSVGEIFTPGLFFLGPVALAAVAAAIVALIGVGVVGQLLVFIIGSIATVALLRPIARRTALVAATALNAQTQGARS